MNKVVPVNKSKNLLDIIAYKYAQQDSKKILDMNSPPAYESSLGSLSKPPEEKTPGSSYVKSEFGIENPIKNKKAQDVFLRARVKLKGLLLWTKILKEIKQSGVESKHPCDHLLGPNYTTQIIEIKTTGTCIINPNGKLKDYWNSIMLISVCYVFTGMPWVLAFLDEHPWNNTMILEVVIDGIFFIDMIITFNSSYYNIDKVLVTDRKLIALKYIKGMFFIDLVSIFPFYMFDPSNSKSFRSNTFVRLIKITKMIRIFKASKLLKVIKHLSDSDTIGYWDDLIMSYRGTSRLVSAIVVVLIFAHINSCFWYFFAKIDGFSPDTWVTRGGFEDDSIGMLYLRSLYFNFTVMTTVGLGDIVAYTMTEMVFCIFLMLLGIGFYSFLVGTLSSVLTSIDAKAGILYSKYDLIEKFAKETFLPENIAKEMKKFCKNNGEKQIMEEDRRLTLINMMDINLRYDIAMNMFDKLPKQIFFFLRQEKSFIVDIIPRLKYVETGVDEILFDKGEYPTHLYFLAQGRVNFVYGANKITFKTMIPGSYFGEIEIIEKSPRKFYGICETPCKILLMEVSIFNYIKHKYPDIFIIIQKQAAIKKKKIETSLLEIINVIETVEIRKEVEYHGLEGKKRIKNKLEDRRTKAALQKFLVDHMDLDSRRNFDLDLIRKFDEAKLEVDSIDKQLQYITSKGKFY
jgi:CRP-like cAMP-binding protein